MPKSNYRILLVEDQDHMVTAVEMILGAQYGLRVARSLAQARSMLRAEWPDLMLLDLGLPDGPGTELLQEIRATGMPLDVVVITVSRDISVAVEVMKSGALDYIQKPFEKEDLLLCVQQAHEHWRLRTEVQRLRNELYGPFHFGSIVAQSPQMLSILAVARKMARSEATVLITGESGTGKELVARAIHCDGNRREGPFVAVNCAQFSGTLLESELFGHEKGAFTGATGTRKGRFELAHGGTLFLDEVGNTSPEMQSKILRVVETREFERVGGQETIGVDVRLLAATNADLMEAIRQGKFREDLYYRLNVVPIEVPPLRERKEDIPALCRYFLNKHCSRTNRSFQGITPEAMGLLTAYRWRGNVRELQNVIEMAVALEDGEWVTTRYLPAHILACTVEIETAAASDGNVLERVIRDFERRFLEEQLRIHDWNHRRTARALGVHRNTVENKIKKLGIREESPSLP
ncbi:MAG: sigma-54-dependent Fis family transcriptional regulator [Candidatus Brocadiaceae bacterium]|mgnify:CR=1 FL=1|nr:sigma-54-dependent Fis family transcriptional regulator [Candidatus Brocadiaceae bacterium]